MRMNEETFVWRQWHLVKIHGWDGKAVLQNGERRVAKANMR